jgi:hypothetical protein
MCAAPTPQPARLWLKPAQGGREAVWTIKDGGRRISTGCGAGDRAAAQDALALYLRAKHPEGESARDPIPAAEVMRATRAEQEELCRAIERRIHTERDRIARAARAARAAMAREDREFERYPVASLAEQDAYLREMEKAERAAREQRIREARERKANTPVVRDTRGAR